ncbi:MAG: hypothetical protein AMJ79_12200 [Phycisphaerae bacterium SM23_30]|nr:MAG: hypothetical protein AMJ79_12200 [Phycisphaerae bacterium SM23_30]
MTKADQWRCDGGQVMDLHWFGNYEMDGLGNELRGSGINSFHLSIHKDEPSLPWPLPGAEDWSIDVPFSQVNEHFTGLVNIEGCRIYEYKYILPDPYPQEQGEIYWFDISAKSNDAVNPAMWRWQEAQRAAPPIIYPAAEKLDNGPWKSIIWGIDPQQIYSDFAFGISSALSDPIIKWSQPPEPYVPEDAFNGWDEPSLYGDYQIVADDWVCRSDDPVTDIHWWGSLLNWYYPDPPAVEMPFAFHFAIWTDVPANPPDQTWSRPDRVIWQATCYDYQYKFVGWDFDPRNEFAPPEATFYFECYLPESEWFYQKPGEQHVYWISIAAIYQDQVSRYPFGWKTRPRNPDSPAPDDAVIIRDPTRPADIGTPFVEGSPIEFPQGVSWDMAFVLTTHQELDLDWGDAPVQAGAAGYPTLLSNGGARHRIVSTGPWLGLAATDFPDSEPDGQPDPTADGDDNDTGPGNPLPNYDDENGVILPSALYAGQTASIDIEVNGGGGGAGGYVVAWIDFNGDYIWQAAEQIFAGSLPPGTHTITFPVPAGAAVGETFCRFRISSSSVNIPGPGGYAPDGEVEDYRIYIREMPGDLDWGDAPDFLTAVGYPTYAAHNGANHKITDQGPWLGDNTDFPDAEPDGQPNGNATGDDLALLPAYDDEDGVSIPPLYQGQTGYIFIEVSDGGAAGGGIVQGWVDWDGDQKWSSAEKIPALDVFLGTGVIHHIPVTPPSSAVLGQTFARFRISTNGGLPPDGPAADGEVEDYEVDIRILPKNTKYVQLPDLSFNGIDIRVDDGRVIADDFECTSTNLLTDVHFWGSWKNDVEGNIKKIHLSIHKDDPVGPDGFDPENKFSKPDPEEIWSQDFIGPDEFVIEHYYTLPAPGEYWWDPVVGDPIAGGDRRVWRVDIHIDPTNAFIQRGTPDSPVIYWLDIRVDTDEESEFGWKTRQWPDHFMDDAVFDRGSELPRIWKELRYPLGHPYYGYERDSIDMAFMLTFEDLPTLPLDFGDAPDRPYPTMLPNGARHVVVPGVFLGNGVDFEPDGQQTPDALGDDNDGFDDEDGVKFVTTPLIPGNWAQIDVKASIDGFFSGWIDFNGDGSWTEAGDRIFSDAQVNGGMTTTLYFMVPMTAKPNSTAFARFRYTTVNMNLSYDGLADDGEVEDYTVLIGERCGIKWVQAPDESPNGIDIRVDSSDNIRRVLADDFRCTAVERITGVYLWSSWKKDHKGKIKKIHLSFHSDDPAGLGGTDPSNNYSKPDILLWERDFVEPNDFKERLYAVVEPNEYWWDPVHGELIFRGDSQIWLVKVNIDPEEAFLQKGSYEEPVIYWLDVQVDTEDGEFGWKTRRWPQHFMDDAVIHAGELPYMWNELRYPPGHPYYDTAMNSIDMAFMLTTDEFCPGSADLNCDGVVNMFDWAIFANQWLNGVWW